MDFSSLSIPTGTEWEESGAEVHRQTNKKHQYLAGAKNRNWDKLKWNWWTSLEGYKCKGMNRVNKWDSLISYSYHSGLITERDSTSVVHFLCFSASINI